MIRMTKGTDTLDAVALAICEAEEAWIKDGEDKEVLIAENAFSIGAAWMDGAEGWNGWQFLRGGEL